MGKFASLEVCMYSRCCALFSAFISIVSIGESFAETTSTETLLAAHQDWNGRVNRSVTRDSSVLTEYIAYTSSLNMQGAKLYMSMAPRFNCRPVTSVALVDPTITYRASHVEMTLDVDNLTMDFPSILDRDGPEARFTLSSVAADQRKLRIYLDMATKATFTWSVDSKVPQLSSTKPVNETPENSGIIDFSLLGSQRTLKVMEEKCRSQVPVPASN